jgi:hypothetical protein
MTMHTLKRHAVWASLCGAILVCACGPTKGDQISSDLIGARYRVEADGLYAYGFYAIDVRPKTTEFVQLIPMGIGGSEISFKKEVPIGQVFRIVSAWQRFPIYRGFTYYLVVVENDDAGIFPAGLPIQLELMRGNEGDGVDLNTRLYRRLQAAEQPH